MPGLHPKKDVEEVLRDAEAAGRRISVGGSHAWGKMFRPYKKDACRCGEFCVTSIWSTPKNVGTHAKALRRVVNYCTAHPIAATAKEDKE